MKKRYFYIFTILSLVVFPFFNQPVYKSALNIRVQVASHKDEILIEVKGPYKIEAIEKDILLGKGNLLREQRITPQHSGVKMGEELFKIYGIRIIPENSAAIYIDKKPFRGVVDIIRDEKMKLFVVNHIDVEQYLYGVLYHEVPHYWPMNAVKAQAVAARTFAVDRMMTMKDRDYDVTNDIYSQVYGGKSSERNVTRIAVNSTKGELLTYKGKVFPSYYHAICAGHTEDASIVFGINLEPLRGKKCPYCKGARGMNWKAMFSYKQIEERLNKYGIKIIGIKNITEGKRDKSGRLLTINMSTKNGVKEVEGYKFRLALGPNVIRSTDFTIKVTPKGIIFKGKGWGHGVGMCQWGVFGMAKRRFDYKKILKFYYPQAEITSHGDMSDILDKKLG